MTAEARGEQSAEQLKQLERAENHPEQVMNRMAATCELSVQKIMELQQGVVDEVVDLNADDKKQELPHSEASEAAREKAMEEGKADAAVEEAPWRDRWAATATGRTLSLLIAGGVFCASREEARSLELSSRSYPQSSTQSLDRLSIYDAQMIPAETKVGMPFRTETADHPIPHRLVQFFKSGCDPGSRCWRPDVQRTVCAVRKNCRVVAQRRGRAPSSARAPRLCCRHDIINGMEAEVC